MKEGNVNKPINFYQIFEYNQKGNFEIVLGVLFLLLIVVAGTYYLMSQKNSFNQINQNIKQPNSNQIITSNNSSDWKTFTSKLAGVTVNYPTTWVTPENEFISEKMFVPGEQDRSKTYNIIEIHKYQTQLYAGYTNSEWFNKINSLTTTMSDQRSIRIKLSSGIVASGEQYVIFTDESSTTAVGDISKQVKAYILKGQIIYQLSLDLYDQNGLETFQKIIPTTVIN